MASLEDWVLYGDELRRPLCVSKNLPLGSTICVVGAGLSGLTVAYRIASKRPDVNVEIVEKSERIGGVIDTWKQGDWICDVAVNATRSHPAFWRLVNDLNLGERFKPSNNNANTRWISINGRRRKLSPWNMITFGPLRMLNGLRKSRQGKLSVAEALPLSPMNDAMTLGIVNDRASNVDADFLMPSMTRFGEEPPIKWTRIKHKMKNTYPLFQPKNGSTASFAGGMQTLIERLGEALNLLTNVSFTIKSEASTPKEVALARDIPLSSVIWCAPLDRESTQFTEINVYAVGYSSNDVSSVPVGYGILIPDEESPISGILHESDVHGTPRAPEGHRLFRIMSPALQNQSVSSIKQSLRRHICDAEPVLFEHIGARKIPSYPPGYMATLSVENPEFTRAGWFFSGVSVTHIVVEAERIASMF